MRPLTSDPGVPLPTRGCTFRPKLGLPSSLGDFHLSPQGPPSQSNAFPADQGRELPIVTTSTLIQGLPLPILRTSVLTKDRPLPTVTFSTLTQDPPLSTKDCSTFDPVGPPAHNRIFHFPPQVPPVIAGPPSRPSLPPKSPGLASASSHLTPHPHPSQLRSPPHSPGPPRRSDLPPVPSLRRLAPDEGTSTPWGFRDLSGDSPLSPAQTHSLPPRPPPPELPFESREPSHRAAGSSLASGTEPGSGRRRSAR